jgi:hypothetical protein
MAPSLGANGLLDWSQAPVAQWIERSPPEREAAGSNPAGRAVTVGAVDRAELADWIAAYERAWRTPGTEVLAELFAPDAVYSTAPYAPPYEGLTAIAELWEREREGPDEVFTMRCEIVAVEGDTGVARVEVIYGDPIRKEYRDLWIVRLDAEGRAVAFEEWPFWPRERPGSWAGGPGAES